MDVNSPLKPPPQNLSKDQNTPGTTNGRKTSISHGQGGSTAFGMTSPTSTRPGTRRRETSDTLPYSSVASPGGTGRFSRDEPSPFFARKGADPKDPFGSYGLEDDSGAAPKASSPFGGLMRSNTAGSALGNGPASPWGATATPLSATLSPMGNFGSFALSGGTGQPSTPGEKRPGFGSMRGESRLAHLMPKDSSEDLSKSGESARGQESSRPGAWRSRPRTDTDPFGDDPIQSAPGGARDAAALAARRAPGFDTPNRQVSGELGMSDAPGFRDSAQRREQVQQTPQGYHGPGQEHLSPTDTNPYGSPNADPTDNEGDDGSADDEAMYQSRGHTLGGIPEHGPNFGNLSRGFPAGVLDGSDRSQNSSAGASKGFPSLGGMSGLSGLSGLGGWPTSANPIGTPDRERSGYQGAFGNSIFGPMGDMQSPSLGNLGGPFGPASSGNISATNTAGRGSKLGSLFPAAMQLQMQVENEQSAEHEQRQGSGFGAIGRNAFNGPPRDTDSPMRSGRGAFEDLLQPSEHRQPGGPVTDLTQGQTSTAPSYSQVPAPNYQQSQSSSDSTANQMPQTQQRQMVMPDRMRWVYLDPQGQTQGPWSGLEMHDWYKASFFTADLSVKKVEDAEFEPLGQLIRRIGNSREPFLVPQIGVPHGAPSTQAGAPFAPVAAATAPQPGSVQPPFAGSFPSFGTTLTAEQQNALERRKQEEQYLMARQREFLAQQQVSMKQMQMQGLPSALHHHSSAHSLQSQPSFGSITSPIGMPPQAQLPGVSSFFEGGRQPGAPSNAGIPSEYIREDDLARLSLQERQQTFGQGMPASQPAQSQVNYQQQMDMHASRAAEQARQADPQGFKARLREFELLRAQHDAEQLGILPATRTSGEPIAPPQQRQAPEAFNEPIESSADAGQSEDDEAEPLSLTQQVQKAASAKHSPAAQPESPWGKVATGLPMPFPAPPQSTTPLPAPTAQRGRSNLPEALSLGTRSRSETPDLTSAPPSVAPWAKEQTEAQKGPSLKEIQDAEARKAAKLEEAQAAARRAALEQERLHQPVAPAPGLPANSTWGSSGSPIPAAVPSAWAKATAVKAPSASAATAASKKTLADIQREEELRKQKLAAATATTVLPGLTSGGKRYADLASKPTASPANSAWSTVGAGGKVKIPTGPAAAQPSSRAASNATVPTVVTNKVARPPVASRSVTTGNTLPQGAATSASQEFTKWAKDALAKGLNTGINGKSV